MAKKLIAAMLTVAMVLGSGVTLFAEELPEEGPESTILSETDGISATTEVPEEPSPQAGPAADSPAEESGEHWDPNRKVNLVSNGDMEEGDTSTLGLKGWGWWNAGTNKTDCKFGQDDTEAYEGQYSLLLSSWDYAVRLSPSVKATGFNPGRPYIMSMMVKMEDIVPDPAKSTDPIVGVYLRAQLQYSDGTPNWLPNLPQMGGTADWTEYGMYLETTEATSSFAVEPYLNYSTGKVWIDDVWVYETYGMRFAGQPSEGMPTEGTQQLAVEFFNTEGMVVPAPEDIVWESSDESIATVENGLVTTKGNGTFTITAEADRYHVLSLTITAEDTAVYKAVRDNWADRLTGNNAADIDSAIYTVSVADIKADAEAVWTTFVKKENRANASDAIWADLDLAVKDLPQGQSNSNLSVDLNTAYTRLKYMALAWATENQSLHGNADLLADIIDGLEWMYTNVYNENYSTQKIYGNWWHWGIGMPQALCDILVLVYDELDPEFIQKEYLTLDNFNADPNYCYNVWGNLNTMTSANLMDTARIVILKQAIGEKGNGMTMGADALTAVLPYVTSGDGFYTDGSCVQHTNLAYTGGYGVTLLNGVEAVMFMLDGTPWEVTDPQINNVFHWILEGIRPLVAQGAMMDMVKGRGIARPSGSDMDTARGIMKPIVHLAQLAPENQKQAILSFVKQTMLDGVEYYGTDYYKGMNLRDALALNTVLTDDGITASGREEYVKIYGAMDKAVVHTSGFSLGIGMYSSRIGSFEYGNKENSRGWNTSAGALYLYAGDQSQYADTYWPTVDHDRLAGITTDGTAGSISDTSWNAHTSSKHFVGGSVLGDEYASIGMEYQQENSKLEAKKSWFVFGDVIVAIGSDIYSDEAGKLAETIVENRKLKDGTNKLITDGAEVAANGIKTGVSWAWLEGNTGTDSTGYYFPEKADLAVLRQENSGSWNSINSNVAYEELKNHYLSLAIEHGVKPNGKGYSYVLLPGRSQAETEAYAAVDSIRILTASEKVHAVEDTASSVTGYNFFAAEKDGFLVARTPLSVTVKDNGDDTYTLAISDPTQRNTLTRLTLCDYEWEILSTGAGVTTSDDDGYPMLMVPTSGTFGKTFTVTVKQGAAKEGGGDPEDPEPPKAEDIIKNGGFEETDSSFNAATNNINWQGSWADNAKPTDWKFQRYPDSKRDPEPDYLATIITDDVVEGDNAVKLQMTGRTASTPNQQLIFKQDGIAAEGSTEYSIAFWYKSDIVTGGSFEVRIDESRTSTSTVHRNAWTDVGRQVGEWTYYEKSFTTQSDTNAVTLAIIIQNATGTLWLDGVQLFSYVPVTGVEIAEEKYTVVKGSTVKIDGSVVPANASDKGLVWSSSHENIATVDTNGVVTGKAAGTATIKAVSSEFSYLSATCVVEVLDGLFKINEGDLALEVGNKRFLTYIDTDAGEDDGTVTWVSDKPSVAAIDAAGLLVATGEGTAAIKLTSGDGQRSDTITVTVDANTTEAGYVTMRERWLQRIMVTDSVDTTDVDIKAYVDKLSDDAEELLETFNYEDGRKFLWDDPREGSGVNNDRSAHYTTQFKNIRTLALAFSTKDTALTGDAEVFHIIMESLEFMTDDLAYNGTYPKIGNWWDWQIGCTQPFVDILMLLKDYIDDATIARYVSYINGYAYDPKLQININGGTTNASTANLTDIGLAVLGQGVLIENSDRVKLVVDSVEPHLVIKEFVKSNPYYGDGMYPDGSYIDHSWHAYTGSYGNEFIKGIGRIMSVVAGTEHDFDQSALEDFYNYVLEAFLPLLYNGKMMSMVNGRSIARLQIGGAEQSAGNGTMANLMVLAKNGPDSFRKTVQSAVKYNVNASSHYYNHYERARDIEALVNYKEIMTDDSVTAQKYLVGVKLYGGMDRVVQANQTYTVGLALNSARISGFESINGENMYGYHTGSGMLYVYNEDLDQFGLNYWPTVDPYRLPGITVDTSYPGYTISNGIKIPVGSNKRTGQNWAGGATDGAFAAVGFAYNGSPTGHTVTAKKSYFLLDGAIVQLGTDIQATTTATVETTVDNRMLNETGSNRVLVNGEEYTGEAATLSLEAGSWIHLQSDVDGADMAYYFPEALELQIEKEQRSGTYIDINTTQTNDTVFEQYYLKMGINHGTGTITNEEYYYITLPGATAGQAADFARYNGIVVVQNDANAQAIRDVDSGLLAINYWGVSNYKVEWIEVDASASVLLTKDGDTFTLSIAEPKHNNATLTVKLDYTMAEVVAKDDAITVVDANTFTVDTTKAGGASFQISFKADIPLTGISLNRDELEIEEGLTAELNIRTQPSDATNLPEAVWTSDDETVATVADGVVTAVAPGTATIKVTMGGFESSCEVKVFATTLTGIEITQQPAKTVYTLGDDLDTTGLEVTASYTNGTSKPVTGYTLSGFDSKTAGAKTVTVTYEGMTAQFQVNVLKADQKEYKVTSGNNSKYTGKEVIKFVVDADLDMLENVSVGSKRLVSGKDYTAASGSTVITLSSAYLGTLQNGTYRVEISFTDGLAVASFTVAVTAGPGTPGTPNPGTPDPDPGTPGGAGSGTGTTTDGGTVATGDTASLWLWMLIAILGGMAVLACALVAKRRKHNN